jgi:hypothetical protein
MNPVEVVVMWAQHDPILRYRMNYLGPRQICKDEKKNYIVKCIALSSD